MNLFDLLRLGRENLERLPLEERKRRLRGRVLVAHSARFDLGVLRGALQGLGHLRVVPARRERVALRLVADADAITRALDVFERPAFVLHVAFVAGAIRGRVMFVSMSRLHERLLVMMFLPVFFFFCLGFH